MTKPAVPERDPVRRDEPLIPLIPEPEWEPIKQPSYPREPVPARIGTLSLYAPRRNDYVVR